MPEKNSAPDEKVRLFAKDRRRDDDELHNTNKPDRNRIKGEVCNHHHHEEDEDSEDQEEESD